MKRMKIVLPVLLLIAVGSLFAFSSNKNLRKVLTLEYIQWTGASAIPAIDFIIGTTSSSELGNTANFSGILSSPTISCSGNGKVCLFEITYTGSQPTPATVTSEIQTEYDRLVNNGTLSLFKNNYSWTGASGTVYKLKTKS